ncbi:hypothetical protein ILP97_21825 [Amycolatopsis sp. H6(2020)]|nr:hypothetical protein [Amycolatopsis sp. H6(2020)]
MVLVKDILRNIDVGSSVAEHDKLLENYFVETEPFRAVVEDRDDVVAGDKGTGKSALYRILSQRYGRLQELNDVEVVSAFNPVGMPVFQRLEENEVLNEVDYIKVWKSYFLALAGNWILEFADGDYTDDMERLDRILSDVGLRTHDDTPAGVFKKVVSWIGRNFRVKSAEGEAKLGPAEIRAQVEFAIDSGRAQVNSLDHDDALRLLESTLKDMSVKIWLTLDRLDEAFQSRPTLEQPVLRALFRAYLDMQEFDFVKVKLFVRRDLFRRIIGKGFVNLTHVNSRKIEIVWDDADLYSLLHRRLVENRQAMSMLALDSNEPDAVFSALFPAQVDPGDRKPNTWTWILGRISDANGVKPPRNLIDLMLKAREAQLRQEDREPRKYEKGVPLITSDSLKQGLIALSEERVEDTLLAEAGEFSDVIELFRGSKAEHNDETLRELLGEDYLEKIKYLKTMGFLGAAGVNYKIPILFRSGLSITQGKAF